MEYLLLLLIIPLIPFFLFSTILSAWIFALGIPFIIAAALGTFLRGFLLALFSRNILPELLKWKEYLQFVRRTGNWKDGPPSNDPPTQSGRITESHAATGNTRSDDISPILSNSSTLKAEDNPFRSYALELDRFTDMISEFFLDQMYPNPDSKSQVPKPCPSPSKNHIVKEFIESISIVPPKPKDTDHRFIDNTSRKSIFDELAAASELSQTRFYSVLESEQSLFTAKTHKSILDEMAEISSNLNSRNGSIFDELATTAADYLGDVSPGDSASQVGTDKSMEIDDISCKADLTDAAKLLSMFSASKGKSKYEERYEELKTSNILFIKV
jgi:hypothetical protein